MIHIKSVIYVLLAVLLLSSCHSGKKAAEAAAETSAKEIVTVNQNPVTDAYEWKYDTNFTSKVRVTVDMGDKSISTTGMLRMRKDDVIQLTLVDPYLGLMEVGRLEISPDSVLVIDRMNKRYMSETYENISMLAGASISFSMVQRLFWTEANEAADNTVSFTVPLATPVSVSIKLSSIGSGSDWDGHTKVTSKYSKVGLDTIFRNFGEQ